MLSSYRELTVWQKSIDLVAEIYKLTESFPKPELYGLSSQMRRASVSIPSNIAEGYSRNHRQEYIQFLKIAFGSGAELETQIVIAKRLRFAAAKDYSTLERVLEETMKMLNALIATLSSKP